MIDGSGGYLLALLTDSFAVRAMIGTLAALLLVLVTIRFVPIRSALARRLLVLAPVVTAAVAAVASIGGQFIPTVMVMGGGDTAASGGVLDVLGESRQISQARSVSILLALYGVVCAVLLSRRLAGALRVRMLLRRADVPGPSDRAVRMLRTLSASMGVPQPTLRLVRGCPGGAFTVGRRHPSVALDPALAAGLDDGELRGLLAHEVAHIRHADPLTALAVGVVRDLAFFLPGIHIAARWLCVEQEESADALAAASTRQPGALASSLLKVWQSADAAHDGGRLPTSACAAAGGGWGHRRGFVTGRGASALSVRAAVRTLAPAGLAPWSRGDAFTAITRRVERLIGTPPAVSVRRRRLEAAIGVAITGLAAVTALAAPTWLSHRHADLVGFFYLSSTQATTAESPAMATFRALATDPSTGSGPVTEAGAATVPGSPHVSGSDFTAPGVTGSGATGSGLTGSDATASSAQVTGAPAVAAPLPSRDASARQEAAGACPCVATPSQLAAAQSASPTGRRGTAWGSEGWTLQSLRHRADLQATRRLLLMDNSDQQVGFLTAGRSTQERDARPVDGGPLR